jgi:hypothetical protein
VKKVWVEEQLKPGAVDWPAVQARLREQGVVLGGGGADYRPTGRAGQQTGSKRLKPASLNHAEWVRREPGKPHE